MPGSPKLTLRVGPVISFACRFPLASKIVPLRSKSVQVRTSVWPLSGFTDEARPSACCARNLPIEVLSAVLPLPNRSYEAPTRTDQSFQQGRQDTGAMLARAACAAGDMNRPALADCSGVDALK